MNALPPLSRTCAHQRMPFRLIHSSSMRTLQSQLRQQPQIQIPAQQRQLSTTIASNAQPIDLTSSTTPASPSESSTLTSDILSRAPTDSTLNPSNSIPSPTPTPPSHTRRQKQQQQQQIQQNPPSASSSSSSSPPVSTTTKKATPDPTLSPFLLLGTVSRTGTMTSAVQLTMRKQRLHRHLQTHYTRPSRLLAHDPFPASYLREGDVVEFGLFSENEKAGMEQKRVDLENRLIEKGAIRLKTRKGKERDLKEVGVKRRGPRWVVRRVVTPFGVGVEDR